jgi:hypothetical protein
MTNRGVYGFYAERVRVGLEMADRRPPPTYRLLLGIGLDSDGHTRATTGEDFVLLGGTEETHAHLQDGVERFQETLRKMGTDLQSASDDEVLEAASESGLID